MFDLTVLLSTSHMEPTPKKLKYLKKKSALGIQCKCGRRVTDLPIMQIKQKNCRRIILVKHINAE
jgi:hypothetical protein